MGPTEPLPRQCTPEYGGGTQVHPGDLLLQGSTGALAERRSSSGTFGAVLRLPVAEARSRVLTPCTCEKAPFRRPGNLPGSLGGRDGRSRLPGELGTKVDPGIMLRHRLGFEESSDCDSPCASWRHGALPLVLLPLEGRSSPTCGGRRVCTDACRGAAEMRPRKRGVPPVHRGTGISGLP